MGNTKDVGDETEARVLAACIGHGHTVSVPFGDNDRYDLLVDIDGNLQRVQCKTGWIEGDCVRFKTASKTTVDGEAVTREYGPEIDAFAVRCRDTGNLYWVPRTAAGAKSTYLRLGEPEIEHPSVNRASEYAFADRIRQVGRSEDDGR